MTLRKSFYPSYIFAFLIVVFSSLPTGQFEKIKESSSILKIFLSDFTFHVAAFGVMVVLLYWGFSRIPVLPPPFLKMGIYSFLFGLFIEFYQLIFPYRDFALNDLAADLLGVTVVVLILWGKERQKEK
ncbi:VanZ family protein [bacterium]|nr:VanZ family protein [bacterium]